MDGERPPHGIFLTFRYGKGASGPNVAPGLSGYVPHGLFLKLHNLSNRHDAKVAKTNKFDVSACGETTSGKLGVLGVLAVKNAAYVVLQKKTMVRADGETLGNRLEARDLVSLCSVHGHARR